MGTDIHVQVERRENGQWIRVPEPPKNILDDWVLELQEKHQDYYRGWFIRRNYSLFAALADVRNGFGFAGVVTGKPVKPISSPRGFPSDLSKEVLAITMEQHEDEWLGDHSFSWLTLRELQSYDWNQTSEVRGVVSEEQFLDRVIKHGSTVPLDIAEHPYEEWSGGISGPGITTKTAEDVLQMLEAGGIVKTADTRLYVSDRWLLPYRHRVKSFLELFIPALEALGEPDDVRMIFGFDS